MEEEMTYFICAMANYEDGSKIWFSSIVLLQGSKSVNLQNLCAKIAKHLDREPKELCIVSINPAPALEPQWRYVEE